MDTNPPCGCFAWLVSVKRSCNERWAKFRNNIRTRFYRNRPDLRLDTKSLDSETGKTIEIKKIAYSRKTPSPQVQVENDNTVNDLELTKYVTDIINASKTALVTDKMNNNIVTEPTERDTVSLSSSIISQLAETAVTESLTCLVNDKATLDLENNNIISEQTENDDASMSSSIISQLAETAVVESLTCLVNDSNESATRTMPKTISEFMGCYGIIDYTTVTDGMPPVSD